MRTIRILGIAPYEGMKSLMETLVKDFPQINLTVFIGDLDQGVEVAKQNIHGNFDVIISRGGTSRLLREGLSLPVVEIEISMYDILCAMKLANTLSEKTALVSYADTGSSAQKLTKLMGYDIDIYPLESQACAEDVLRLVQKKNYPIILCDMIANTTAQRLGLNSVLITSGLESIRQAFQRAIWLCASQEQLREENRFFRELINYQISETVLLEEDGTLYLSTIQNIAPELLALFRREVPETSSQEVRRVTRILEGMIYSIRIRRVTSEGKTYVGFFFTSRKNPLPSAQTGVRYFTRAEAENAFLQSVFSYTGMIQSYRDQIEQINKSRSPVLISGEDGTGMDAIAFILFTQGPWQNSSLVCINCSQLGDKGWKYLMEHHSSPLADEGNVLYFSNIDILNDEHSRQLLSTIKEMEVCRRNRVFFSCVCHPDEKISVKGALFADELCCLSFYITPLRCIPQRIPTLVNIMLSHLNADSPNQIIGMEPDAMELLCRYMWPHNFTQLRRVIGELAATSPDAMISASLVSSVLRKERHVGSFAPLVENDAAPLDLNRPLCEINRDIVLRVVEEAGGNQSVAAKRLGIGRTTLWRYIKKE